MAQSRDLIAAAVLLASLLYLRSSAHSTLEACCAMTRASLAAAFEPSALTADAVQRRIAAGGISALKMFLPVAALVTIVTLGVGMLQTGFLLRPQAVSLQAARISPRAGLRRLVSLRSSAKAALALGKIAVLGAGIRWGLAPLVRGEGELSLSALGGAGLAGAAARGARHLSTVGLWMAGGLLALALLDWAHERWQLERDLRMSRREILEEQQEQEPDARLRRSQMRLARKLLGRSSASRREAPPGAGGAS